LEDLKEQHTGLQREAFPKLRTRFASTVARFQAIDL
jgi:hypothetical protein